MATPAPVSSVIPKPKKILSEKKQAALLVAQQKAVLKIKQNAFGRRKTALQVAKAVAKIQIAQAEAVARAMLLPALGTNFIYKIVTHRNKKEEVLRREHVLIENPHEIAHALDCLANDGGKDENDEDLFYYASKKDPDYRAGEAILNRAVGKVADKTETTVKIFSLVALAKERQTLPEPLAVEVIKPALVAPGEENV